MNQRIKRILCFFLASIITIGTCNVALAKNTNVTTSDLEESYQTLMNYAEKNGIDLELRFDTFIKEYNESTYTNVTDYVNSYYNVLKKPTKYILNNRSSFGSKWYYNTGTSLPQKADYSKYNLLNTVQKGDIIFEAKGGLGITAHVAIVEGIFYSVTLDQYYVRLVEAITQGVVRSVLDDSRVDDKDVTILRVNDASDVQKNNATKFCISQVGKSYSLDFAKDTSTSESNWYCSELVWAGYYNNGINIETTGFYNEPGITPRDILNSSKVTKISFK